MHSTFSLEDGYLGSGKRLWYSIRKYGKENHKKEILEFCKDRTELKQREQKIVNKSFIKNPLCMNIQEGGGGGFSSEEHMKKCCNAGNDAFRKKLKVDKYFSEKFSRGVSDRNKEMHRQGKFYNFTHNNYWLGNKHKPETIEKIKLSLRGKQEAEKNSQYGTMWIYNIKTLINKKISKTSVIPEGWAKGRILKPSSK